MKDETDPGASFDVRPSHHGTVQSPTVHDHKFIRWRGTFCVTHARKQPRADEQTYGHAL